MGNSQDQVKCEKCKYFSRQKYDDPNGQCRRYAPHPSSEARIRWPEVNVSSWCGEYERRAEKPSPEAVAAMKKVMDKQIK